MELLKQNGRHSPGRTSTRKPALAPRLYRQGAQRGAVVFAIVLAIMLLGGLGVWAMRVTALGDRASGYSRLALQAQYLSELGVQTSTAYLAIPGYAQANYQVGFNTPDECLSVKTTTLEPSPFCRAITLEELNETTYESTGDNILDLTAAGSLSAFAATDGGVHGNFLVELSEPSMAMVAGDDANQRLYRQVSLSSHSALRPDDPSDTDDEDSICVESTAATATRSSMRAISIIGPIY